MTLGEFMNCATLRVSWRGRGFRRILAVCLLLGLTVGCQDESTSIQEPARSKPATEAASGPVEVPAYTKADLEELAKLGAYLPPLDDKRIRVAPPLDWRVEPRDRAYVTRFAFDRTRRLPLPRITIEVEEIVLEDFLDVDAENQDEFVKLVNGSLEQKTRDAIIEVVDPIILGTVHCARYAVKKKFQQGGRTFTGNREVIKTLADGRIYTILLDVYPNQLPDYRADAYAVVAGMEFLSTDTSEEESTADDDVEEKVDGEAEPSE